jgi:hypothetical protein
MFIWECTLRRVSAPFSLSVQAEHWIYRQRRHKKTLLPRAQHVLDTVQPRRQFILYQLAISGLTYHNLSLDILVPLWKRV